MTISTWQGQGSSSQFYIQSVLSSTIIPTRSQSKKFYRDGAAVIWHQQDVQGQWLQDPKIRTINLSCFTIMKRCIPYWAHCHPKFMPFVLFGIVHGLTTPQLSQHGASTDDSTNRWWSTIGERARMQRNQSILLHDGRATLTCLIRRT